MKTCLSCRYYDRGKTWCDYRKCQCYAHWYKVCKFHKPKHEPLKPPKPDTEAHLL